GARRREIRKVATQRPFEDHRGVESAYRHYRLLISEHGRQRGCARCSVVQLSPALAVVGEDGPAGADDVELIRTASPDLERGGEAVRENVAEVLDGPRRTIEVPDRSTELLILKVSADGPHVVS